MQAYDNPVFVEDIVRNVAARSSRKKRVTGFTASAANQESIHNHSAVARVRWSATRNDASRPDHQFVHRPQGVGRRPRRPPVRCEHHRA